MCIRDRLYLSCCLFHNFIKLRCSRHRWRLSFTLKWLPTPSQIIVTIWKYSVCQNAYKLRIVTVYFFVSRKIVNYVEQNWWAECLPSFRLTLLVYFEVPTIAQCNQSRRYLKKPLVRACLLGTKAVFRSRPWWRHWSCLMSHVCHCPKYLLLTRHKSCQPCNDRCALGWGPSWQKL